jgi:methylmalonyl-CoA mutase cobalamin-binding subunit
MQNLSVNEDDINSQSAQSSDSVSSVFSPDSYYSAEKTAARIVDFALSFYNGGDREDFARMVQEAVLKGFDQAKVAMGGTLPSISEKTISLVLNAINQFASGVEV